MAGDARRQLLRWSLRLLLFWSPILVVGVTFEWVLWRTGESWSLEHVLDAQQRDPRRIFVRQYIDQGLYRYKYLGLIRHRPRILALGSSRVMMFRAGMFGADSGAFYNAGGIIQDLADLESFVRLVPDSLMPRVIILGVDMWWLNPNYRAPGRLSSGMEIDGARSWQSHLLAARAMARHPRSILYALHTAITGGPHPEGIGLGGRGFGSGFRADGSEDNGLVAPSSSSA